MCNNSLPNLKKPCKDCPFRKDSKKGWLGASRMKEILEANTFTCHKTVDPNRQQCAGHMLMLGTDNQFVYLAGIMRMELMLSGRELLFETKEECIAHHD